MAITAFSKYRLLITRTVDSPPNAPYYVALSGFNLWTTSDHSGTRLSATSGATVSSSSTYASNSAANAFDLNTSTYWESDLPAGTTEHWIKLALPSAVQVRSFMVTIPPTNYNEFPADFKLQGSNDGTTWTDISVVEDFAHSYTEAYTTTYFRTDLLVAGTSLLSSGAGASRVLLHKWDTGEFVGSLTPNATTGAWEHRPSVAGDLLVTHIGPTGYKPISDGPISPVAE